MAIGKCNRCLETILSRYHSLTGRDLFYWIHEWNGTRHCNGYIIEHLQTMCGCLTVDDERKGRSISFWRRLFSR